MQERVKGPAIALIVLGWLGIAGALINLVLRMTGLMADMYGGSDPLSQFGVGPGLGLAIEIASTMLGIAISAFVIWAASRMRNLQGWGTSIAASILVMLPCSACCCVGIPIGIWALVVLNKPEVREAFTN